MAATVSSQTDDSLVTLGDAGPGHSSGHAGGAHYTLAGSGDGLELVEFHARGCTHHSRCVHIIDVDTGGFRCVITTDCGATGQCAVNAADHRDGIR